MGSARGESNGGSKGSGGPGGGGRYNFQARATAFVYAHVLAGQPLSFAAKRYPVPLAVWAESGGPGDDLRVECQNGVVVEVQAKRGLSAGEKFWEAVMKLVAGLADDPNLLGVLLIDSTASNTVRTDFHQGVLRLADGRPRRHSLREILDAIFYIVRSGCAWRLLPHEFPPWKTIHHYFRIWRIDGTWERMHDALRHRLRARLKRDPQPSTGVVDSQSVKTTGVGGKRGYDGGKKVKGRKRHLLVDTEGLVLKARVHVANVADQEGIKSLLDGARELFPRLKHLWLDAGYRGEDKGKGWVEKVLGWSVDLVERPKKPAPEGVLKLWAEQWREEGVEVNWKQLLPPKGFQVLPRRWVVERTFSWINHNRRMSLWTTRGSPRRAKRSSTWR